MKVKASVKPICAKCRVIRRKNDYEQMVFNGELGTITDISDDRLTFGPSIACIIVVIYYFVKYIILFSRKYN